MRGARYPDLRKPDHVVSPFPIKVTAIEFAALASAHIGLIEFELYRAICSFGLDTGDTVFSLEATDFGLRCARMISMRQGLTLANEPFAKSSGMIDATRAYRQVLRVTACAA